MSAADAIPPWEIEGLDEELSVGSFEEVKKAIADGKLPETMSEFLRGHFEVTSIPIRFIPK